MSVTRCGEFELIRRYFSALGSCPEFASHIYQSVGDDCAVVQLPPAHDLVFSMDTLVAGVHFPDNADPKKLAGRALRVNLSDLAAMGATPWCFTLGLTLPDSNEAWLAAFAEGLAEVANEYGIALVGGDTTRGPLCISIEVKGLVPAGKAILRRGAQVGDLICVSGDLGDAGGALPFLSVGVDDLDPLAQPLLARYWMPEPRISIGQSLRNYAHAAIDISDGLVADLQHILTASNVGAELWIDQLPVSESLRCLFPDTYTEMALSAGDDYELCFCLSESSLSALKTCIGPQLVHVVGKIVEGNQVRILDVDRQSVAVALQGYRHF